MNRSDNQSNDDAEGYDLDHVLDDAFASRRVPVLSPSMMDVRRRARRRTNRTRATGLAAVACVSVGGVALLANNHKPGSRPAVGAAAVGYDEAACATTTTWELLPTTTLLEVVPAVGPTVIVPSSTTALAAGFLASATSTTGFDVVTPSTTCLPQPPSGFRCIGDPTITRDGWIYYDYCETIDTATLPTPTYWVTTVPWSTTEPVGESGVYTVVSGDYLFDIAQRFCTTADFLAEYNSWPEGLDHVLQVGDVVVVPPSDSCVPAITAPASTVSTTEVLSTTTTAGL